MQRTILFYQLILRPLLREPVRTVLTILAIALGVAMVLAIDLAGTAAAGSFQSSVETLAGKNDLEVVTAGGVPENLVGSLEGLPYPLKIAPRIEDYAVVVETKQTLPLLGLDLVAEAGRGAGSIGLGDEADTWKYLTSKESIWLGESLGRKSGETITLLINDQTGTYTVRGIFPDLHGSAAAIVMDISAAQSALKRFGRIDRVLIQTPSYPGLEEWQQRIRTALPDGVQVRAAGAGTNENRRMLAAFRWNLRLLSYIALVVGAFLIYNTISVSVVRRRAEIGIARALGASRRQVLTAFLGEAASIGGAGVLLGIPLGRLMAGAAVKLMGVTVSALYVTSRPGAIAFTPWSVAFAFFVGASVTLFSAWSPAREAALVAPVEAMARGRREFEVRATKKSNLWFALILAIAAAAVSLLPPIGAKPLFGYLATLLTVAAGVFATPAFVDHAMRVASDLLQKLFGVEV